MEPCYDGIFFNPGQPFNQGYFYKLTEEQLVDGLERVMKLAKTPNPKGRELAAQFTYKRTVDEILAKIT